MWWLGIVGLVVFIFPAVCLSGGYALKDFGAFHIGGRQVSLENLPVKEIVFTKGSPPVKVNPNGDFEVEQMYVQYFIPSEQVSRYPLLMWHGGGLCGVTWETKPDGNPGWMNFFIKAGHPVYVSDAVERGRASWARYPEIFRTEPLFRTKKEAWEYFRMGPKESYDTDPANRKAYPGMLFPVESFDQFAKQVIPRWVTNDVPTQKAYDALVQKVGSCVIMPHSQGGNFAFNAALNAPDKVKGIIAIEPSGAPKPGPELETIKHIPILIVWGDYMNEPDLALPWKKFEAGVKAFADDVNSKGGSVDWLVLPEIGIKGNDHMLMMDTNSDAIALVIHEWMGKNDLLRYWAGR
jgi:pimeloyl-ACP methyl ester carboxylesterase